jgi:crotonobetainyl-CoA:carnitine CoA-transferase CaiB-like acyl-CoA transferase
MAGPLTGVRVLELDLMAPARYTGYLLAALGAEVINFESPAPAGADKSLTWRGDADSRWLWYQQNKKSVVLNLKSPTGREILHAAAKGAQVVIDGFRPGAAARLGADYETLRALNPALVYCSVTAFGQDGPYKDLFGRETAYGAVTGLVDLMRPADGPPGMLPFLVTDIVGGTTAALAISAAVTHALRTGQGQYIDAATYDAMIPFLGLRFHDTWQGSWFGSRPRTVTSGLETMDTFETRDGRYVVVTLDNDAHWVRFCEAIGRPDLLERREHARREEASPERDAIRQTLGETFRTRTMADWAAVNDRFNLGLVPVLNISEVAEAEHTKAREMVTEVDYEPLGRVKTLGIPFKFSETPGKVEGYPRYGENTRELVESLGLGLDWGELVKQGVVEA